MRVLIVLSSSGFFRHFDTVVQHLCDEGHDVKVLTRMANKGDEDEGYQEEMVASVAAYPNGAYDFALHKRHDALKARIRGLRAAANYAIYFRDQHNSPQLGERMAGACPPLLRDLVASRGGRRLVSTDGLWTAYRELQRRLPADPSLLRQVSAQRPDVVVACPFIYTMSADVEYIRAAQRLGVPTVAAIASWDNLSTKGAFHLLTDSVLVWNDSLACEAELIHAIPRERIVSTGAAKFDAYFELGPTMSRERFCAAVGIDPGRPYLLYLGSSHQVAGNETGFVADLARALQDDPRTAGVTIVVRPHPLNAAAWAKFEGEGIRVFPARGQRPDLPRHRDDYLNTLSHAAAATGVNTTAFLEAAIADRPCLSVVSERHRQGQVDRGHFHHLLAGGFLQVAPDLAGAVEAMAGILDGADPRRSQRRRFVEQFVRPAGGDRPAGEVMAQAIVDAASSGVRPPQPLRSRRLALARP